jgi:hypothetical protein
LVWAGAPALAEEKVIHEADKTIVRKKTVIDFTDVAFQSLVKVRDNFIPELQKSADNL